MSEIRSLKQARPQARKHELISGRMQQMHRRTDQMYMQLCEYRQEYEELALAQAGHEAKRKGQLCLSWKTTAGIAAYDEYRKRTGDEHLFRHEINLDEINPWDDYEIITNPWDDEAFETCFDMCAQDALFFGRAGASKSRSNSRYTSAFRKRTSLRTSHGPRGGRHKAGERIERPSDLTVIDEAIVRRHLQKLFLPQYRDCCKVRAGFQCKDSP